MSELENILLFTDGSVNTKAKIGFGAYLLIKEGDIRSLDELNLSVKTKRFENTSSTKLELQTLLWAFSEIPAIKTSIQIYTDSQNILSLLKRRKRLEENDFISKSGVRLKNFELYIQFYKLYDTINCEFYKIKGHKKTTEKNQIDKFFTLVDRASRSALRSETLMHRSTQNGYD